MNLRPAFAAGAVLVILTSTILKLAAGLSMGTDSASVAASFDDCSAEADGHTRPDAMGPYATTVDTRNPSFHVYRPVDLSIMAAWPALVFMHGSGSDDRFLADSLVRWASHGFIVVTPLMGTESDCTSILNDGKCSDTSPDGKYIQAGVQYLKAMNALQRPDNPLYNRVDTNHMAIGGWSMGGVSAIRAAAAMPPGSFQAVVLDSPSVEGCGLIYNYTQKEIQRLWGVARSKTVTTAPWFLYTSTNDVLQRATLGLFETGGNGSTIYAQYKTKWCSQRPPHLNETIWQSEWALVPGFKGHFCSGLLTMVAWTTTYLKMVLQQHSNPASHCHDMVWGSGNDSIANDTRMDAVHTAPRQH